MESDLLEDQEILRERSSLNKEATEHKPKIKAHEKLEITTKKTSEKGKTAETNKIQTMEYFRKKKDAEKKGTVASAAVTPQKGQSSSPFQGSSRSQSDQTTPITPRRKSPISLSSCENRSTLQIQQRRTSPRNLSPISIQAGLKQKISTRKSLKDAFNPYPSQLSSFHSNDSKSLEMPDTSMDIDQAPLLICQLETLIDRWEREHQAVDQHPSTNNSSHQIPDTSLSSQNYSVQQTSQYSWSPMQNYQQSIPSVYSSQQLLPLVQASPLSLSSVQASQCSMLPVRSQSSSHYCPTLCLH